MAAAPLHFGDVRFWSFHVGLGHTKLLPVANFTPVAGKEMHKGKTRFGPEKFHCSGPA